MSAGWAVNVLDPHSLLSAFGPIGVGVLHLPARVFTLWRIFGGVVWSVGVVLTGYWLGSHIRNVDHYLLPIITLIVGVLLIPLAVEVRGARRGTSSA